MAAFLLMLFLFQAPGEQTRGPSPQQIVVRPDGFDIGFRWGELAGMCTVLSAIYFVIAKFFIGPMIDKKLAALRHQFVTRQDLIVALKTSGNESALRLLEATWAADQ